MDRHYQFTDKEFVRQFQRCDLDATLFNHEAHLRLAYLLINDNGVDKAINICCEQIHAYAVSLGEHDKFNKTVTVASVKAVYHFKLKSQSDNFKDLLVEFPRLKTNFKELLAQHYDIDIFNSAIAKSSFLEPNLLPFD